MNALRVLLCFDAEHPRLTVAEIIERSGLSRATVYRVLKELTAQRLLYRSGSSSEYILGTKMVELGLVATRQLVSSDLVQPVLVRLRNLTGESVTFNLYENGYRTCAAALQGFSDLRHVVEVGRAYPLHLGAAGLVILATLPQKLQCAILEQYIADERQRAQLLRRLQAIADDGYVAASFGERVPGSCAVSAAVRLQPNAPALGSVSIVGPEDRLRPNLGRYLDLVRQAAQEIVRGFTGDGSSRLEAQQSQEVAGRGQ